jgi:RNA polymerase sigma factor (sigma-70 family)
VFSTEQDMETYRVVVTYAYRVCYSGEDARDLTQEGITRLLEWYAKGNQPLECHQERTWLINTVRRLWIDHLRKKSTQCESVTNAFMDTQVVVENYADDIDYRTLVSQMLAMLPLERDRLVFLLYIRNVPPARIASLLRLKGSTVRMQMLRIREKLAPFYDRLMQAS